MNEEFACLVEGCPGHVEFDTIWLPVESVCDTCLAAHLLDGAGRPSLLRVGVAV